jgi:5-hydroxyisourate hydrolase-like protein (transthyretin family)
VNIARLRVATASIIVAGAALTPVLAIASSGSSSGLRDPRANVAPSPQFDATCMSSGRNSATCINAIVAAINNARAHEGVGAMHLPSGFASMSTAEQTFVVSNLERIDRGLAPASGMVSTLNTLATTAAHNDADPILRTWSVGPLSVHAWGSNWAGDLNALAADYDWMYDDGWGTTGSFNLDCTSATAAGCWGHRHNILGTYGGGILVSGVGSVPQSSWTSIAQIFVAGSGSTPTLAVSWRSLVSHVTKHVVTATLTGGRTIAAGHSTVLTGHVRDATVGTPLAEATVRVCHHVGTSTVCQTLVTNTLGVVHANVHPTTLRHYWLEVPATTRHAHAVSNSVTVQVHAVVHAVADHLLALWRITAQLTPVHGQVVTLQRNVSGVWHTVKQRAAASSMAFTGLRSGSYRLVASAVSGVLGTTSATVRA